MLTTINLARSPFLQFAVDYINSNPGCTKQAVVLAWNRGVNPPSKTKSGQYSRLQDLINSGLVENSGTASKCSLKVK